MTLNEVATLEPNHLWKRFYEITQVPRPSKKEEKIRAYLRKLLTNLKIKFKEDKIGNILAYVPATSGYEKAQTIILQGHVDMVCEKNRDVKHDFENDPLKVSVNDGWVVADGTTLGSDNGIGVAAALAIATDKDAEHGPLEILMTVDEETGLTGATNLEPGFITGKILLNLDSEEDGSYYIGCAGGIDTVATFTIETESVNSSWTTYKLVVDGLKGGHSGLDIIHGRGNAIKILGRTLKMLDDFDFRVVSLEGGSLRNAIPRDSEAVLVMNDSLFENADKAVTNLYKKIFKEYKSVDSGLKISIEKSDAKPDKVYTKKFTERIIDSILALPNGVISMNHDIPGLVETSTNLATIRSNEGTLRIGTSQRSSSLSQKEYISESIASVFKLANAEINIGDGYPGWEPDIESELLKISKDVYYKLFGKQPEIKAIHAGLECGILETKNPGMEMISFGPTIQNAHSPTERVNIETVDRFYQLLKSLVKDLSKIEK
jgi:dipeptidase D